MDFKGFSRVAGIGAFLPNSVVESKSIMDEIKCERFGVSNGYMEKVTGIKERRVSEFSLEPSDLATLASEQALIDANIEPEEIDFIIYCGIDRDWHEPATGHQIQSNIGACNAICLDAGNACNGFMSGVTIADSFIGLGRANNVLVCAGEQPSRVMLQFVDKLLKTTDKNNFKRWVGMLTAGDSGAAMILQPSDGQSGWKNFNLASAGQHAKLCNYKYDRGEITGQMLMEEISTKVVDMHEAMMKETYRKLSWSHLDIDRAFLHQAGKKPHLRMKKVTKLPMSSIPSTYEKLGNLTSCTIPVIMTLNRPARGDRLLVLSAGSGISICQAGMIY